MIITAGKTSSSINDLFDNTKVTAYSHQFASRNVSRITFDFKQKPVEVCCSIYIKNVENQVIGKKITKLLDQLPFYFVRFYFDRFAKYRYFFISDSVALLFCFTSFGLMTTTLFGDWGRKGFTLLSTRIMPGWRFDCTRLCCIHVRTEWIRTLGSLINHWWVGRL